jgi:hypothetical protein
VTTGDVQTPGNATTTLDRFTGVLLRLRRDGDYWHVSDLTGIRYGSGETFAEALAMWAACVEDTIAEDEATCGGSYLAEVRAYKQALEAVDD